RSLGHARDDTFMWFPSGGSFAMRPYGVLIELRTMAKHRVDLYALRIHTPCYTFGRLLLPHG
ncbi:MAG: hypothetical protein QGI84_11285, partial [Dehalococcoidia bacterium]|nr:hypothetical protein [Dehalococcoidia bacterium]